MKKTINQLMVAAVGLVAAVALAQPQVSLAGTTNVWQFPTSANPVTSVGSPGGAICTVVATNPVSFKWNGGIWDLGGGGTMTLTNLSSVVGVPGQPRSFTLRVVECSDPIGIYPVTVSIPGATCVQTNPPVVVAAEGLGGEWDANVTQWSVTSAATVNTVVITGASGPQQDSLVNQVSLVSSAAVIVQSPQLTMQSVGSQQFQITCSATSNMELQTTTDLSNPNSWTNVMQVTNGTVVTIKATNAMQFYRLK